MSVSANRIARGAMRGIMPPHRLDASLSQTTVVARKAGSRACVSQPGRHAAAPAQNPKSDLPRINPVNPEPAPPAQNPKSAFSRINSLNPEPAPAPVQNPKSAFSRIDPLNPERTVPPVLNPGSAFSRINPLNPEPAAAPTQNPESAFSQINPLNPERTVPPAQIPNRHFPESTLWTPNGPSHPRNGGRRAATCGRSALRRGHGAEHERLRRNAVCRETGVVRSPCDWYDRMTRGTSHGRLRRPTRPLARGGAAGAH